MNIVYTTDVVRVIRLAYSSFEPKCDHLFQKCDPIFE